MTLIWPAAPSLQQVPFRRLFRPLSRPVPDGAAIVTAYTDGEVTLRSNRNKIGYNEASDLSTYQGVKEGDFVVHGLDILRGSVGVADSDGAMSPVCIVCQPLANVVPRYVAYAVRAQAWSGFTRALARGIREGGADFRRWATLAELPIPVPDPRTQRLIADYLDRETAQIDTLIQEQQRLINLLRERRIALIDARLEPQAGWVKHSLRRVVRRVDQGVSPQAESGLAGGDAWGVLKSGCVNRGKFEQTEHKRLPDGYVFDSRLAVSEGDLLVARASGSVDLVGSSGIVGPLDYSLILSDKLFRLVLDASIETTYLYWYLNSRDYREQVRSAISGAQGLANNLPLRSLLSFRLWVPEPKVQKDIANRIQLEVSTVERTVRESERLIELAKERRNALITAAVTGRIDVRDVA